MDTTTSPRKLSALVLGALVGPVALASSAVAAGSATFPTPHGPASPGSSAAPVAAAAPTAPAPSAAPTAAPVTPLEVEQRLAALKYDVGPADGVTDEQTSSALMAFQKVHGLERTGDLTEPVADRIMATHTSPPPIVPGGEPDRIEVSLARQVLFLYQGGTLFRILPISSGTAETPTPTGEYRIYRFDPGWHTAPLGELYNAEYFIGGYAIHGSKSVPAEPASHGCIRIPMSAAEWFPNHVDKGMQVLIVES